MSSSSKTSQRSPRPDGFWDYVPDPSRTIVYLLLAVTALVTAEWVPEYAAQIEQVRMQEQEREVRDRQLADIERWRRLYPQLDQQREELLAQEQRQAELEAAAEYQLAKPMGPMPMTSDASTTQALWN